MSLSILIVDDEPLLAEELSESLELEGYVAESVGSAAAAIDRCAERRFDVVVTDLKMPGMGGLDLIRELKSKNLAEKIIVLSGHGAETNRVEAKALGAVACHAKPLDIDDLLESIATHCA